jgi:hypothetical protein
MVFAGMPGLHRLLYISRQALMADDLDVELGRIVHEAMHTNRHAAVTGFLVCHDGWFVQVLEGPGQAVLDTFDRIGGDSRHKSVRRIAYEKASGRMFAEWDMCARRLSDGDEAILADGGARFDPSTYSPSQLLALLNDVADRQRAALAA